MLFNNNFFKLTLPILIQSVKAHRKPRWLPVAKSKVFRIPKRPVISDEERLELQRIHNNYKTQMRAIRRFYYEDMIKEKSTLQSASSEMSQRLEAEEWDRCVQLNEQWNSQVAADREMRRMAELELMEQTAQAKIKARDEALKAKIEKANEEIRLQKELSATFITPETLDAAIDHALSNPTDYNFVIDLHGQRYMGRDTPITSQKDLKAEAN